MLQKLLHPTFYERHCPGVCNVGSSVFWILDYNSGYLSLCRSKFDDSDLLSHRRLCKYKTLNCGVPLQQLQILQQSNQPQSFYLSWTDWKDLKSTGGLEGKDEKIHFGWEEKHDCITNWHQPLKMLSPHTPLQHNDSNKLQDTWQSCDKSVMLHWASCKQYKEGIVLTSPHVVCLPRTLKLAERVQSKSKRGKRWRRERQQTGGRGIHKMRLCASRERINRKVKIQ